VHSERAILDVLFPKVRAQLLRLLFDLPQKQRYVRELANMSGLALCTIQDELRRLTAVGLLTTWSNGYHRFYRANKNHPLFPQLIRLVHKRTTSPDKTLCAQSTTSLGETRQTPAAQSGSASSRPAHKVGPVFAE
jgi:predicted transcriptional regulator